MTARRLVSAALCLAQTAGAGPWQEHRLPATSICVYGSRYLVYLPEGYAAEPARTWPVIVFLHGAGERGEDFAVVKKQGLAAYLDAGNPLPAIVLVPQVPARQRWHPLFVNAVMEDAARQLRFDPKRIYLTGLSMGGMGSWTTALVYPHRFAAMAPIAGCLPNDIIAETMANDLPDPALLVPALGRLKDLPVWVFHGSADFTVEAELGRRSADLLKQAGGHANLTIYPGQGHDSWTSTYSDHKGFYPWLFAQERTDPRWDEPSQVLELDRYTGVYAGASEAHLRIEVEDGRLKLTGPHGEAEALLPLDATHFVGWELIQFEAGDAHLRALVIPGRGTFTYLKPLELASNR